jgi:hypothetical protein
MDTSVERAQALFDVDGSAERAVERTAGDRALEAAQPPAGVRTTAGAAAARNEPTLIGDEPKQLALGRSPPAADTAADRVAQADDVPSSVGAVAGVDSPGAAPSLGRASPSKSAGPPDSA